MNHVSKRPFVKVIRTNKATYVYDVNSANILKVSKKIGDVLENWDHESKLVENEKIIKFINKSQEDNNLLLSYHPEIVIPNISNIDLSKGDLNACSHVILSITDSCNLRCNYCIYSGLYVGRRKHSNNIMSWETARKAIDLLTKNPINSSETLILGFYGGEPLLRFDFIRSCVEYANLKLGDSPHLFGITTNGTLLNEDIIDYLVANKFIITISFDGPKEIHDKNRCFISGEGTFENVSKNIEILRNKCGEDYFKNFVNLSAVLTPPYNFVVLNDFFSNYFTNVRLSSLEYRDELYTDMSVHHARGWSILAKSMKDYCLNKSEHKDFRLAGKNMLHELFARELRKIHNRLTDQPISGTQRVLGLCQPGKGRAFVSYDGKIYLCERVEGNENMLIGAVETGIDIYNISKIINNISKLNFSDCKNCWIMRFCSLCFAHIVTENAYSEKKWKFSCEGLRNHYEVAFKLYCQIMEEDEAALDFLISQNHMSTLLMQER